jgi:hypothetical protein
MHLELLRYDSRRDYTKGLLFIDGEFECYTLEDEYRALKVWGESRIPDGEYKIQFRTVGGHHARYTKRFGKYFHRGMLELQDVPNFKYILIHIGNTDRDTAGCILVGSRPNDKDNGVLDYSTKAYRDLYPQVRDALLDDDEVIITIKSIN